MQLNEYIYKAERLIELEDEFIVITGEEWVKG